jgi:hypothetical protein
MTSGWCVIRLNWQRYFLGEQQQYGGLPVLL